MSIRAFCMMEEEVVNRLSSFRLGEKEKQGIVLQKGDVKDLTEV